MSRVPVSDNETIQNQNDNMVTVVDLCSNDNDMEKSMSNMSTIEDDEVEVIAVIPFVNLCTHDSKNDSKNDLDTSDRQITDDNIQDVASEHFSQAFRDSFNISTGTLCDIEKELSDTMDNKYLQNKCKTILKTPKILTDSVPSTQLNVNKLDTQLQNFGITVSDTDLSTLITTNSSGEAVCHFYWWDACENAYEKGVVYLFGKVYINSIETYYSCCLAVKPALRRIYLLPKKSFKVACNTNVKLNTIEDVHNEFKELAKKLGIKEYQSRYIWKKCVFEKGVPNYTEYLEIRYSGIYPAINPNYLVYATIEKVFESTISPMQLLLIERNIKGPCWLDIKCPMKDVSDTNWCKVKLECAKIENISVSIDSSKLPPPPPIVIATLNVRTCINTKTKQNEIIMVTILLQDEFKINEDIPKPPMKLSYCLIIKPRGTLSSELYQQLSNISYTNVIICQHEGDLLEQFLQIIEKIDPDLYIGYECNYQFDVLLHRMITLKIDWSRMGKLKDSMRSVSETKMFVEQAISGRPIYDIKLLTKELNIRSKSYDLQSLCSTVLKKTNNEHKEVQTKKVEDLIKLTFENTQDILLITYELNIIPLAIELTCIAGHILSKTLTKGQMERNEFLLLHAFHLNNYILPDCKKIRKYMGCNNPGKEMSNYEGGLVLNPTKGFYNKLILLMDYMSLYPSIIIEYNLCFTTVPGAAYTDYKLRLFEDLKIPGSDVALGIIPEQIYELTKYRAKVKELMELPYISSSKKMHYNVKQIALKLMVNSIYGCLGAPQCRFYAKGLAALITSKGREILLNTKSLVEFMQYEVIYGDTDSIMIQTNVLEYNEAIAIGNKIKQEVHKLYKSIKLNIDSVFKYLLLYKKKRYAAVVIKKLPSGQIEQSEVHKGIETVRKDSCPLITKVGKEIITNIFSEEPRDIKINQIYEILQKNYEILQNISRTIREHPTSLSALVISKELSKNLDNYYSKEQPHIQVAKRLNRRGTKIWGAGDVICYVICKDEIDKTISNAAYHIDEIKENVSLNIDIDYYLKKQIFPIVLRLCEPFVELNERLLAKHLGLLYESKEIAIQKQVLMAVDKFNDCTSITFACLNQNCKSKITISSITSPFPNSDQLFLNTVCPNESCKIPLWKNITIIYNQLQLSIRQEITKYYSNELKCTNPQCSNIVTKCRLPLSKAYAKCKKCKTFVMSRNYTETKLYNQIYFYYQLFDISKYECLLTNCPEEVISVYNRLRDLVDKYLKCSSYLIVNFNEKFQNKYLNYRIDNTYDNISSFEYTHMDDK